jgi:hypothetical protein
MYATQCEAIASAHDIDHALWGLTDQIAQNAESFPVVGATERFRLGKTDSWGIGLSSRILFEILDDNRVLLAAIKAEGEEEFIEGF